MRHSGLIIIVAVLMVSACGKKSEQASTAVEFPTTVAEQQAKEAVGETAQTSAEAIKPEATLLAPAVPEAPVPVEVEKKTTSSTEKAKVSDRETVKVLNHDEGLDLANKSGCLACHKIEAKLVGPAWRDVSKRYKGEAGAKAHLVAKVKAGGKGNWTDVTGGIAMPPYSPRVSDEDIEKLVSFVLSLSATE